MMRVNAYAAGSSSPLGVNILVAEGSIGSRPASTHHQCLEVVFASKADCDRAVILVVVVHLVARHRPAMKATRALVAIKTRSAPGCCSP
jgi:hypothetical protein